MKSKKGNGRVQNLGPNCIMPAEKKKQKARGTGAARKGTYTRGPLA